MRQRVDRAPALWMDFVRLCRLQSNTHSRESHVTRAILVLSSVPGALVRDRRPGRLLLRALPDVFRYDHHRVFPRAGIRPVCRRQADGRGFPRRQIADRVQGPGSVRLGVGRRRARGADRQFKPHLRTRHLPQGRRGCAGDRRNRLGQYQPANPSSGADIEGDPGTDCGAREASRSVRFLRSLLSELSTSLRGARRRSNPRLGACWHGLLRFARNDGRELRYFRTSGSINRIAPSRSCHPAR